MYDAIQSCNTKTHRLVPDFDYMADLIALYLEIRYWIKNMVIYFIRIAKLVNIVENIEIC